MAFDLLGVRLGDFRPIASPMVSIGLRPVFDWPLSTALITFWQGLVAAVEARSSKVVARIDNPPVAMAAEPDKSAFGASREMPGLDSKPPTLTFID